MPHRANAASTCWFLTGPTASGKTLVGMELARLIGAEIVSLDSMALYRGMDIGTAKPSLDERQQVPHHLVDILEPWQEFSLSQYLAAADRCIGEIASRGHQVLFVGGTPLYLKGLLRGIFEGPAADPDFRRSLETAAQLQPPGWLHNRLAAVDPAAAARLHPNDARRLVRALEVYEKTGVPISHWQRQFETALPAEACKVFSLAWPREALHERVDSRVERMFAEGLVDEVRTLTAGERAMGKTARQAVGYAEVIEYLDGRISFDKARELVKRHTRQLAKRQQTWFRSLSEVRACPVAEPFEAEHLAAQIAALGKAVDG